MMDYGLCMLNFRWQQKYSQEVWQSGTFKTETQLFFFPQTVYSVKNSEPYEMSTD